MITGDFDDKTQDQIAQLLGVTPRTIYEWKKKADWEHIKGERRKLYSHHILKIDNAMIGAAEKGDVKAAQIVYERFDGWIPTSAVLNLKEKDEELLAEADRIRKEHELATKPDLPGTGAAPAV